MTPTGREILTGAVVALAAPAADAEGGAFGAARLGVVSLLCLLMAQEIDKAAAVRVQENRAIRNLFGEAAEGSWAPGIGGRLRELARGEDNDLTLPALDAANAELRRVLIQLHAAVETSASAAGRARERRILRLLRESAAACRLDIPFQPAG